MGLQYFIEFCDLFKPPSGARALAAGLGTLQVSYVFSFRWELVHFGRSAASTLILFVFKVPGLQAEPVHWQLGLRHCQLLMWSVFVGSCFEFEVDGASMVNIFLSVSVGFQAKPVHWKLSSKHCNSLTSSFLP